MNDPFQIKAITSFTELEPFRKLWENSQWHPGADFEFFKLVVENRSEVISPCVFVVFRDQNPITLLVGRFDTVNLPIRFGYATLVRPKVKRLVIMEGGLMGDRDLEIWKSLLLFIETTVKKENLDLIVIEQLKRESVERETANQLFGGGRLVPAHTEAKHWLLKLPETWESFLKSRGKKHRYWIKRLSTILDRDFQGEWEIKRFHAPSQAVEFVDFAEAVAKTTYHRTLGVGFQRTQEAIQRIKLEARRNQLQGYVLFIKGEPKAFWYCFCYSQTLFLAATGYAPDFKRYEVGTVLLMQIFQDHCGKVGSVDFGLGDAGYKERFGTECFHEASFLLFPKTFKGICLNSLQRASLFVNGTCKSVLNRLQITQRIKTFWRNVKLRRAKQPAIVEKEKALASGNRSAENQHPEKHAIPTITD